VQTPAGWSQVTKREPRRTDGTEKGKRPAKGAPSKGPAAVTGTLSRAQRGGQLLATAQALQTAIGGGVLHKLVMGDKEPGHEKNSLSESHHQHRARIAAVVAVQVVAFPDLFASGRLHTLHGLRWKGMKAPYALADLKYDLACGFLKFVPTSGVMRLPEGSGHC
jgi:hypothetical protein